MTAPARWTGELVRVDGTSVCRWEQHGMWTVTDGPTALRDAAPVIARGTTREGVAGAWYAAQRVRR